MEKGNATQFKNKNLDEIDIDMNELESLQEEENEDRRNEIHKQFPTVLSGNCNY